MVKARDSEVDAYIFIKENLKTIGWNVQNPARNPAGEVYTQNECLNHPEIKKCLVNKKPENVVKLSEKLFWIIEAKRSHKKLGQALSEAEQEYAKPINEKSKNIRIVLISGVAGNDASVVDDPARVC